MSLASIDGNICYYSYIDSSESAKPKTKDKEDMKKLNRRPSMMTKYLGPTNHNGARVKAVSGSGKSLTMPWDYALDVHDNHAMVAGALADMLSLTLETSSCLPEASKFAFVFLCEVK